jgi:hypothetical protein
MLGPSADLGGYLSRAYGPVGYLLSRLLLEHLQKGKVQVFVQGFFEADRLLSVGQGLVRNRKGRPYGKDVEERLGPSQECRDTASRAAENIASYSVPIRSSATEPSAAVALIHPVGAVTTSP